MFLSYVSSRRGALHLSDYIKSHLNAELRQRGVIVNREVEIRSGIIDPGEKTDIHVDAISRNAKSNTFDRVSVIIEVKGCWNDEVETAMQTQLVQRYLRENQCKCGIYVVGWYLCDAWTHDYRKNRTHKMSLEQARLLYNAQALSLSNDGLDIRAFVLNTALSIVS